MFPTRRWDGWRKPWEDSWRKPCTDVTVTSYTLGNDLWKSLCLETQQRPLWEDAIPGKKEKRKKEIKNIISRSSTYIPPPPPETNSCLWSNFLPVITLSLSVPLFILSMKTMPADIKVRSKWAGFVCYHEPILCQQDLYPMFVETLQN